MRLGIIGENLIERIIAGLIVEKPIHLRTLPGAAMVICKKPGHHRVKPFEDQ